jgi:hypothetical protein
MPIGEPNDDHQPASLCPAEIEFLAQVEKLSVRNLNVAVWLKEYRTSTPSRQEELKAMIDEAMVSDSEIESLWKAFQEHRAEHGCRGLYMTEGTSN